MPKIPRSLTAMAVNKLKNGRHAVGGAVGLYLDKSSSSAGSWIYRYTSPDSGKIVQMGLGSYPAVTLSQARLMAVDYRSTKELGLCPLTQRLQKQQNKNEALRKNKTFKEVALLVCELKEAELMKEKLDTLSQVEAYVGTFFSKKYVQQHILRLTDREIEQMQNEINKEANADTDDGGIDVPQDTDGVTRYPSAGGAPIPADDLDKYQGNEPEGDDK